MANVYTKVRDLLGLNADHQGREGYLYLFLTHCGTLEDVSPVEDTFENPFRELLEVRLAEYAGSHAHRDLSQLIGARG
jgi:hypothetical protein